MGTTFKLIANAALKEYHEALEWYGYTAADFELIEKLDPPPKADSTWGFAIVTRKSTGVTRSTMRAQLCVGRLLLRTM